MPLTTDWQELCEKQVSGQPSAISIIPQGYHFGSVVTSPLETITVSLIFMSVHSKAILYQALWTLNPGSYPLVGRLKNSTRTLHTRRAPCTPLPRKLGAYSERSMVLSHSMTRWLVHSMTSPGWFCTGWFSWNKNNYT